MDRETVVENEKKEWHSPKVKDICLFNTEGKTDIGAYEHGTACGSVKSCAPS